jgi:hypothetical protein
MPTSSVFVASPPPGNCEPIDTGEFRERRGGGRFGRLVAFVPDSILKMRRFEKGQESMMMLGLRANIGQASFGRAGDGLELGVQVLDELHVRMARHVCRSLVYCRRSFDGEQSMVQCRVRPCYTRQRAQLIIRLEGHRAGSSLRCMVYRYISDDAD